MFSPRVFAIFALVASAAAWPAPDRSIFALEPISPLKDTDFFSSPWSSFFSNLFSPLFDFAQLNSFGPELSADGKTFKVVMKLDGYKKDDIKVKVKEGILSIHASRESKNEGHNLFASQTFYSYSIPENASASDMTATYSSDNYLVISSPMDGGAKNDEISKEIPITETGKPYEAEKPQEVSQNTGPTELVTEDDRKEETTPASQAEVSPVENDIPHGDEKP